MGVLSIPARRRIASALWTAAAALCACGVAAVLLLVLGYILREGFAALSPSFFVRLPRPVGVPGGGIGNGIVGSAITVAIAALMAFPAGIFVGIYAGVYAHRRLAQGLSFLADVLAGVPSIAIGIYAYILLVIPFRGFSAVSASFALAVLMMPLVIRTTEGALQGVPRELREAATALGATDYRVTGKVLLAAARPGIVTGLLLAVARITGETAPLLFTAFGNQFWEFDPTKPMAELPLQIFTYAISPYRDWHRQAWGGALVLIAAVFLLSLAARLSFRLLRRGAAEP
ncbi:MAG TPA: phosphate ABC transporter permease PstA [Stellaceae bacterium]|nr:phosphate ABC transporter permease PstA [Stellaceae bacterium]